MFPLTLAEQEFIDLGARSAIPILAQSSLLRPVAVRKSAGSVAFVDQELFGIDGQLDGCTASRRESIAIVSIKLRCPSVALAWCVVCPLARRSNYFRRFASQRFGWSTGSV